jgi:hypothetical protein
MRPSTREAKSNRVSRFTAEMTGDRLPGAQRGAGVALEQVPQPFDVLHRQRVREPHRVPQLGPGRGVGLGVRAGDDVDDIAGQQAEHQENEHAHPEQRRDEHEDTANDVVSQGTAPEPVFGPMDRLRSFSLTGSRHMSS